MGQLMSWIHVKSSGTRGAMADSGRVDRCAMAGESCLSLGRSAFCDEVSVVEWLDIVGCGGWGGE